ncbi:ribosome-binding ATPase YchF/Obg-like ATPase 1 [Kipferlia bialata]|uniref:Obg-like ATPase 1 n=1 Tax=Kipferlia bialata TaxID=797122 RepID=A0A9K3GFV7_9EUKA|nr:ribosome-binding ATPase YchF/Obg-like ATPase 1 [Kipferlia bialata]|eukprot:g3594.t1
MAKKTKGDDEPTTEIQLLGRSKNTLSCGIVGLPNVGKSLMFNMMSNQEVPSENFPFCTIDPNKARVAVPDERFEWLRKNIRPASEVPAHLEVIDIAGLVRGAHEGKGLGNAFLSNIRAVDGIYHLVRLFDDDMVTHVEGEVDPVRDLSIIHDELVFKDIATLERKIAECQNAINKGMSSNKDAKDMLPVLHKCLENLKNNVDARNVDWKSAEIPIIRDLFLLTSKPVIYLINMSAKDYLRKKNKWLKKVVAWIKESSKTDPIIPFSAQYEQELHYMTPEEQAALEAEGKGTALKKIIATGYRALHLIHFFTVGVREVRCWTIREGCKAPDAAGVIHSDFRDNFICAEVTRYDDLVEYGGEAEAKAAGKVTMEGRNYVVQDGDIMFFKAGQGKKKGKK